MHIGEFELQTPLDFTQCEATDRDDAKLKLEVSCNGLFSKFQANDKVSLK